MKIRTKMRFPASRSRGTKKGENWVDYYIPMIPYFIIMLFMAICLCSFVKFLMMRA